MPEAEFSWELVSGRFVRARGGCRSPDQSIFPRTTATRTDGRVAAFVFEPAAHPGTRRDRGHLIADRLLSALHAHRRYGRGEARVLGRLQIALEGLRVVEQVGAKLLQVDHVLANLGARPGHREDLVVV